MSPRKCSRGNQAVNMPPEPITGRLVRKGCAILIRGLNGHIFAGKELRVSDVSCFLMAVNERDKTAWLGFKIQFPLGDDNEDNGFGMCHACKYSFLFILAYGFIQI